MALVRVEKEIGGRMLSLETGRLARQADGAVVVRYGDTVVLATVLSSAPERELDFFPLYVDYREATYAVGKIPGGFFKREGRPTTKEIITMRMIDRPIRPLFPADFTNEVQIQMMVLSADGVNDPDIPAMVGASAALALAPIPFDGPIGAARIGCIDGELVVNPTIEQEEESQLDLVACGPAEALNMIEMEGKEISEATAADALALAHDVNKQIIELINELTANFEIDRSYDSKPVPSELKAEIHEKYGKRMSEAKLIKAKLERSEKMNEIREEVLAEYCPEDVDEADYKYTVTQVKTAFYKTEGKVQRDLILDSKRPDGRAMDEVRPLDIEVDILPRTHGSSIFARGETQSLCITTLGTTRDKPIIDGLRKEYKKDFFLHYNFPPFSVGELRPIRGPGRREIGHGMLAEKALLPVLPSPEDFPYSVRVVSEILESNGSTSQASICGATLALMDAGVPIRKPVAGISVGMVSDESNEKYVLLTDIVGEEDFHGDMDFKVAGTPDGITAIQLDMKARGISQDRIVETLAQAHTARLFILGEMAKCINEPRQEVSQFAPGMESVQIDPDKIGKLIGPGGKMIKGIQEETGATIEIDDDGTVAIFAETRESVLAAKKAVEDVTAEAKVGQTYTGKVVSIRDFGAFIEILPGVDGLCHVSELSHDFVKNVGDVCELGDMIEVKCIDIDDQGRVKLSRRALLEKEE